MSSWVGVVSRDHVLRGVALGIAQIGHGKKGGLARMHEGDWLVYYSPKASMSATEPLQALTAIGQVVDEEVFQVDEGDFRPWRRRIRYVAEAHDAPIRPLLGALQLTAGPHWGYQLRRGLVEISSADLAVIRDAMVPT